jgi:uncharacterized protein with PIN domain
LTYLPRALNLKIERGFICSQREEGAREMAKEDLKRQIEQNGLVCDCGEKVYEVGTGDIEVQSNYNKYYEYLRCPQCQKLYYL